MTRPTEDRILAFLDGTATPVVLESVLAWVEASPANALEIRRAAAGLEAMGAAADALDSGVARSTGGKEGGGRGAFGRRVPAWWIPVAAAASVALAVPVTLGVTGSGPEGGTPAGAGPAERGAGFEIVGRPRAPEPSFVVVLHGVWPDAADLPQEVVDRRAGEYWAWASDLSARGLLVAAGDLRWEPGLRLATSGPAEATVDVDAPDFLVGMFTVRAADYEEARRIALECPHLRYGGAVSVRRVAGGFVTVEGADDWSD